MREATRRCVPVAAKGSTRAKKKNRVGGREHDDGRRRHRVNPPLGLAVAQLGVLELEADPGVRDEDEDGAPTEGEREVAADRGLGSEREEGEEGVGEGEKRDAGTECDVNRDRLGIDGRAATATETKHDRHESGEEDARCREPPAPEPEAHGGRIPSNPMSTPIARDLEAFFAGWMELEPEEATTLGLHDGDGRLRDTSEAGIDVRARFFTE